MADTLQDQLASPALEPGVAKKELSAPLATAVALLITIAILFAVSLLLNFVFLSIPAA